MMANILILRKFKWGVFLHTVVTGLRYVTVVLVYIVLP